jgi:glycerol-3-phosphate dehydrogenase (NAD(P)+)
VKKIAIIGGGSWGTALAILLSRATRPHHISLWAHSADVVETLQTRRVNEIYLPGFELPAGVEVIGSLELALAGSDIVLSVMPAAYAREMVRAMLPHLAPDAKIVSATKGLEPESHARISEVIAGELNHGEASRGTQARIAVLSGPSFAVEAARGDPTAVVLASRDAEFAAEVQAEFSGPTFRLYTNNDVIGTEIAGAVKNVIAIAAGACAGLGLGANSTAALITRGLAEMTRLAVALGGRRDTIAGLAGAGDLILTATGPLSRNRRVGIELGRGRRLADILEETRMVAEGVGSAAATLRLARTAGVEMPITEQVHAVLAGERPARDAIRELMDRRLKQE